MTEGFLNQIQVTSFFIEPSGECVTERVNGGISDSCFFQPVGYSLLDLSDAESVAFGRLKKRRVGCQFVGFDKASQQSLQVRINKYCLLTIAFGFYSNDTLLKIYITGTEINQGAEPDACFKQKRNHDEIPLSQMMLRLLYGGQKALGIGLGKSYRQFPAYLASFDEPSRILLQIARHTHKAEEHLDRCFDSVNSDDGLRLIVGCQLNSVRSEKTGNSQRLDFANVTVAEPLLKQHEISHVSRPRMFALAISDQLRIKAFDGSFKHHNYLPELMDFTYHMNGYVIELIKLIMRTKINITSYYCRAGHIIANKRPYKPAVGLQQELWSYAA